MKIRSLRLKGYKRFHGLEIQLGEKPSRFIALVGPNGCGKSSILDGLLYLQRNYVEIGNTGQMGTDYHSLGDPITDVEKNIEVTFTNGNYREIHSQKEVKGKQSTIFSFRSPYRHNSNVRISKTEATDEIEKNSYGASTTVALDEKMENNYRRLLAKFNRHRDKNDLKPSEAREDIIKELNDAIENCLDLNISSLGDVESNRGTLFFTKTDQSTEFEYNLLSAGEKEVVDLLLDLYVRKDEYDDTVFLIDEPELHINTLVQRNLLIEINKLVGDNCQLWFATHSIGFLRALQDDIKDCQIIYFEPGVDFAVSEKILKPVPKSRAQWQKIFETALDDLTGLVAPRHLVYCEGKAESIDGNEKGLDAIIYNNIFGQAENETLFVSSGGGTQPEQRMKITLTILKKALPDLAILILSDRDEKSEEQRIEYLREENYRRVLKRREIENYLYDEAVLKKYTDKNGFQFNQQEYEDEFQDIVNQDVKSKTGIIKSLCSVTTSINAEKFKVELSNFITPDMDIFKELRNCIFQAPT